MFLLVVTVARRAMIPVRKILPVVLLPIRISRLSSSTVSLPTAQPVSLIPTPLTSTRTPITLALMQFRAQSSRARWFLITSRLTQLSLIVTRMASLVTFLQLVTSVITTLSLVLVVSVRHLVLASRRTARLFPIQ